MTDQIITKEGYEKLLKEVKHLTNIKRMEIAERIQRAKDMGDLSENAEYSEAKDEQAYNEGRIAELNLLLKNVTIVEDAGSKDQVGMGSVITVKAGDAEKKYTIVSFNEVDPIAGKISNESPIGKAFIGKKKGDTAKVVTPKGTVEYKILNIE